LRQLRKAKASSVWELSNASGANTAGIAKKSGLSDCIVRVLLKKASGRLFATTSSPYMKDTLLRFGFVDKGKEWKSKKGMLSFWQKE
jgi:hypothetical protein